SRRHFGERVRRSEGRSVSALRRTLEPRMDAHKRIELRIECKNIGSSPVCPRPYTPSGGRVLLSRDACIQKIQRLDRMCESGTGAHLGGDPDRFHDLLGARTLAPCRFHMPLYAPWTLRHMGNGHGNELLGSHVERAFGENRLGERAEGIIGGWSKGMTQLGMGASRLRKTKVSHVPHSPVRTAEREPRSRDGGVP